MYFLNFFVLVALMLWGTSVLAAPQILGQFDGYDIKVPYPRKVIGFRSVEKELALRYNSENQVVWREPGGTMLGDGLYMFNFARSYRSYNEWYCVIAAFPRRFKEVQKSWIPMEDCEGRTLYDGRGFSNHDLIDQFIRSVGGDDPQKTVRISHIPHYKGGKVTQMAIPWPLVEDERLGLWTQCTASQEYLPKIWDGAKVKTWERVLWKPELDDPGCRCEIM